MVKAEIGAFAGSNVQADAELNQLLANEQQWLASEHPMFLEQRYDMAIAAGQQYASLPTAMAGAPSTGAFALNLDTFPIVEAFDGQIYRPVVYGIGSDEYNISSFARGQTGDPIQRWHIRSDVNEANNPNKFEVWPVPVLAQVLRFTGTRRLQELFEGTDSVDYIANTANYRASGLTARLFLDALTADLDDMLLVYFVAAKRLARNKAADANIKLQQAQSRLQTLTQNFPRRQVHRTLDGMTDSNQPRIQGMRVLVR